MRGFASEDMHAATGKVPVSILCMDYQGLKGGKGNHCCIDTHFTDMETEAHRAQDTACTLGQSQTTGHTRVIA